MELLAILESRQRRLRAFLPEFVTPFDIIMTKHCAVHDEPNENNDSRYTCPNAGSSCNIVSQMKVKSDVYMLVRTDVMDATDFEGVAKDKDGFIVTCFSIKTLKSKFGMQPITPSTTWEEILGWYTREQLGQSYKVLPIPTMAVDRKNRSTNGLATLSPTTPETTTNWSYPSGVSYLSFKQKFKRPTAYTLDNIPGIVGHFTNHLTPGLVDRTYMVHQSPDLSITKDISCPINLDNCLPVANGLLYFSKTVDRNYFIYGATDVFVNQVFPYASVMMLDFSEIVGNNPIEKYLCKDCKLESLTDLGMEYEIIFSIPESDLNGKTALVSFDGRLMPFDRAVIIGDKSIKVRVSKSEILHMRERDMQLTETVDFNTRFIKVPGNDEAWIKGQFSLFDEEETESLRSEFASGVFRWDELSEEEQHLMIASKILSPSAGNYFRTFVTVLPVNEVYVHEYAVNSRINYNGLFINGNVEGVLQSTKGYEIFEHVICKYMSQRTLTPVDFQTWINGSSSVFTQKANPSVFIDLDPSEDANYDPEVESTAYTDYTCKTKVGIITDITKEPDTDIVSSITVDGVIYTKKETTMERLLYGSDTHLVGYKPYEFLTTLESQMNYKNDLDTVFLSTPYIDRMANEAVETNRMEFKLLDFVKL